MIRMSEMSKISKTIKTSKMRETNRMTKMSKISKIGYMSHSRCTSSKIKRKDILSFIMKVWEEYQKFAQLQREDKLDE
jgi:hypothetical protein